MRAMIVAALFGSLAVVPAAMAGQADSQQREAPSQAEAQQTQSIPAERLRGMEVVGADGVAIGDVQQVIESDGETYVLVAAGMAFGLGERDLALPLSHMAYRDGRLVLPELTEEEVRALQDTDIAGLRPVGDGARIELATQ